jgi:hypothetical protein
MDDLRQRPGVASDSVRLGIASVSSYVFVSPLARGLVVRDLAMGAERDDVHDDLDALASHIVTATEFAGGPEPRGYA